MDTLAHRGLRSLIAHPERHLVADLADRLVALVRRGALVQATAASVTDAAAGPTMLGLAERGVVHVLGSDSHSSRAGRPVAVAAAVDRLAGLAAAAAPCLDRPRRRGGHAEWPAGCRAVAPGLESSQLHLLDQVCDYLARARSQLLA